MGVIGRRRRHRDRAHLELLAIGHCLQPLLRHTKVAQHFERRWRPEVAGAGGQEHLR